MGIEQVGISGKHIIYQDPTLKGKTLLGFKGSSILDTGYIFAPYVPLVTPTSVFPSREQIKEETRVPIKIIKAVLKQAGYRINRDFKIEVSKSSAAIVVRSVVGRRFAEYGQCTVSTMRKGKLSITWTYDPSYGGKASKNVDVTLADPGCFQQIVDTIIPAIKENAASQVDLKPGIISRYGQVKVNPSYYGKITL